MDFEQISDGNIKGITEYITVIYSSKLYDRDSMWNIFYKTVNNNSDSIIQYYFINGNSGRDPDMPRFFREGKIFYCVKSFLKDNFYQTHIVFDSTNTLICIWSFKAHPSVGAEKPSRLMTNKLVKNMLQIYGQTNIAKVNKVKRHPQRVKPPSYLIDTGIQIE